MSTSKEMISIKYKVEYLKLIIKQKTATVDRDNQKLVESMNNYQNEQELLNLTDQPICKPKIFKANDAIPMADDDYLLAELNGHFE